MKRLLVAAMLFVVTLLASREASAQVHWDATAQVGVAKRFLAPRPEAGDDAGFGPAIQLNGHVALLPLLRAGVYVSADSTNVGPAQRQIYSGGIRVEGLAPWRGNGFRAWVFVGFGYAGVVAPSYQTTFFVSPDQLSPAVATNVTVASAGGSFLEIPFGIGGAWALRPPFELVAELGARVGLGFSGSLYENPGRSFAPTSGGSSNNFEAAGNDAFSLFLTIGMGIRR